jgi:hypothetical protein
MNVQASHVIPMLPVMTMKVLFTVNVMLTIPEMDLIVLVSKSLIRVCELFRILNLLLSVLCIIFFRH